MDRIRIMNAFQIKLLMATLMLLDHLRFIHNLVTPEQASFFTLISRCVAPMFAYLTVEGIRHTCNLKRYCLRLFVFAGIMFTGSTILNTIFEMVANPLPDNRRVLLFLGEQNIIFTFACGVLSIALVQWAKGKKGAKKKQLYVLSVICFMVGFLWGEWSLVVLPLMLVEYFFHEKPVFRIIGYILIEVLAILAPFGEPFYFIVFPFILLYNGERGPNTGFSKYFFYIFYPVHLWIIAIINFFAME